MNTMHLAFVKSIGEGIAQGYSINWESWTEKETNRILKDTQFSIKFYEKMFNEFDIDNAEHTMEMFEDVVSGYTLLSILNRKKAVDELLASV